jgi:hypothetical protein
MRAGRAERCRVIPQVIRRVNSPSPDDSDLEAWRQTFKPSGNGPESCRRIPGVGSGEIGNTKKAASRDVKLLDAVRLLEVTELVSVYLLVLPTCRLLVTEKTPGTPLARILAASLSA